jgi:hypothetical protein
VNPLIPGVPGQHGPIVTSGPWLLYAPPTKKVRTIPDLKNQRQLQVLWGVDFDALCNETKIK